MTMTPAQRKRAAIKPVPVMTDNDPLGMEEPEPKPAQPSRVNGVAADELRSFVERIERLEEERQTIGGDIKEVKKEAKAHGFDLKALAVILKIRKQDQDDADELESIVDTYKAALGMI